MTYTINKEDFMMNSQGHLVPVSMVSDVDQARDALVRDVVAAARNLQEAMKNFKNWALGDIYAFVDLSAEKYDVKMGGVKGNLSLVTFDGSLRVQVAVCEHLTFDERLQAAKTLVYECLTEWTEESRDEIKAIVMNAFQANKEGKISTARILGLRRLPISDHRWRMAMDAISDCIQFVGSKSYMRIYERSGPDGKWTAVPLDMAAL